MKILKRLISGIMLWLASLYPAAPAKAQTAGELDRYNVVWTTPSKNAAGAMPLGNGEVGLNLWVEEDGDLRFYISRTDAWSEACRLLKLGRIRLGLVPNPFLKGAPFRQELKLNAGRVEMIAGEPGQEVRLKIFVEARAPVIHIQGECQTPRTVKTTLEVWRTDIKVLTGEELRSSWTMQEAPAGIQVWESADVLSDSASNSIGWHHRNEHSVVPLTLKHQSLEAFADRVKDPLLRRTFGGRIIAPGFIKEGNAVLKSAAPTARFEIHIATHSAQTDTLNAWQQELQEVAASSSNTDVAMTATAAWWASFWNRSWIFVDGDKGVALPQNQHPLRLGADARGASRFSGLIGRASLFDHVLGGADIQSLAAAKPGDPPAMTSGLVAHWPFSQMKDRVVPNSVTNALHAKVVGSINVTNDNGASVGSLSGGYLEVANDPRLKLPGGFTLEAWIKPKPGSGPARIFDKISVGGSDGFLLDTYPRQGLRVIVGADTLTLNEGLQLDQWNHVAATCDSNSGALRIFLNGKVVRQNGANQFGDAAHPSRLTQAYILQRWIAAGGGRGHYPIKFNGSIFTVEPEFTGGPKFNADWRRWGDCFKFNGSIFTVEPEFTGGPKFNADWRRWGDCYWWQNTRLPYFPMLPGGDFDQVPPVFRLYREVLPICQARAKSYYGAEGAYFPETMTIFGTYANRDYGWDRNGHLPSEVLSPWWCYAWQQGLELVTLMQNYYDYTGDARFLAGDLIPMAREVLRYYDTRFGRNQTGKLVIQPTQAVETYWHCVTNDTPSVAGLHAVLERLLALSKNQVSDTDRTLWTRLYTALPKVPARFANGKNFILPAEYFEPRRSNIENPELYAIWPFRLYGVDRLDLPTGIETYIRRGQRTTQGWSYDGQCAAILGLADEAGLQIQAKVRNSHPNHRFPALWGPNYDWLPDQDHGSNILLTLQQMLLLAGHDKIYLLPAWPKEWNVSFKLHAPRNTTVECVYRQGKVTRLEVNPPARQADIVMPAW